MTEPKEMWARCLVYLDKQRRVRNAVLLLWISAASFALIIFGNRRYARDYAEF